MSDKLSEDKEIIKLEKKLIDGGQQEFVLEVRQMNKEELTAKQADLNDYKNALISTKANDEELQQAKAKVSELNSPYNSDFAGNKQKDRFIALVKEEEFGDE